VLEDKTVGQVLSNVINNDYNFTTWLKYSFVSTTNNTITISGSTSATGIYVTGITTIGKRYKVILKGNTTTTNIQLKDGIVGASPDIFSLSSSGNFTFAGEYLAVSNSLYLRSGVDGIITIDSFIIQEIKPDLAPTAVSIVKRGTKYSASFNGTTSRINTGSDFIGTKAITVCGWINPTGWGGGSLGAIIDNSRTILQKFAISATTGRIRLTSDNSTYATSATGLITNQNQFICVTRTTAGVVNFYIGDSTTAPVISGTANQASGTPVAGTTNVFIGNNSAANRTFDGLIPMLDVYEGILDLSIITQIWSESRKEIM
jgi:hypothetical protein